MAAFPGGLNTFVPSWEASGKLQIEFSRNPKSFPLNDYVAQRSVTKQTGYYFKAKAEEASRVVNEDDYIWPAAGAGSRPGGKTNDNYEQFEWVAFNTKRHKYDYPIDDLAQQQADFDVLAFHGRVNAQKAMTVRTKRALRILTEAGNWGNNTGTATAVGGGLFSAGTSSNPYILSAFQAISEAINKGTQGVVRPEHLRCVVSPTLAHTMRKSAEMIDFIKQQSSSPELFKGNGNFFYRWGLPEYVYGIKMVVEDTVVNTVRRTKGTDATKDYMLASGHAIFVANTQQTNGETVIKPESGDGVPIFDTMTMFLKEDMTVESRDNRDDRCIDARIIDDFGMEHTSPTTGYLLTGCA